jgi:hypothetical protein
VIEGMIVWKRMSSCDLSALFKVESGLARIFLKPSVALAESDIFPLLLWLNTGFDDIILRLVVAP